MTNKIAKDFLSSSIFYGHSPKKWNPKMAPYLLREQFGHHIFNTFKTLKLLKLAGDFLHKKAEKQSVILFVGTDKISASIISKEAPSVNAYYITSRWLGGMLTNWETIQKRIQYLKHLEQKANNKTLTKKNLVADKKEIQKLNKLFCGIKKMSSIPEVVVFTNQFKDNLAIQECLHLGIPTIVIVDSNGNPSQTPYPIPANDDSSLSINFIITYLIKRIARAQEAKV